MKKFMCAAFAVIILISTCSCSALGINKKQRFSASFLDLFDTASTIIAYDTSQSAFNEHYEQFYSRLKEYDSLYDIYNKHDNVVNLCTLNSTAMDAPVKVDSRIIDLLEYGKYVYDLSDGRINICFGAVLSLWHDKRAQAQNNADAASLPDMSALKAAAEHTDINDLVIDRENSTVFFADKQMRLDVGAVAKGYAVEQITKWAQENLWTSAAISIGGNVSTFGYKNDDGKTLWNIGIENPNLTAEDYIANVEITDLSVVTSGDYQRYYIVDGKKYCHIINPDTLMPSEYMASVSVICESSALGDALSTTLFNMSIDDGVALVESMSNVEAVWVDKQFEQTYSSGFEQYK